MTQEIKVTITGDPSQVNEAFNQVRRGALSMGEAFRQSAGTATQSSRALNAALRTLPAQITDIVVGLTSGQAPMTVLLQQGGQLKDVFGGIGPAAKAVGGYILGLVNPYTLAAAAAAGLSAAFLAGASESNAFARAIILSGNAANTSVSRLQDLARGVAEATGATQGRAAEVLASLVEQGKFTEDQLSRVASAAIAMERATGQSAEKTVAAFELIGKAPAEALEKLDKAQNFLTASTYEQIRSLIEQGRTTEASRLLAEAYANTIKTRSDEIIQNQGLIERGWNAIKDATSRAVDAAKNIGRGETLQQQLAAAKRDLDLINSGAIIGDAGLAQAAIADLEKRVALEGETNRLKAEQNKLQAQQKEFVELTAIATDKSATANAELLNKLRTDYLATLQAIAAANPGKDPLNTAAGIIATEKYLAKISEIAQEVNKVGIAGEQALREKLTSAMEDGREKAAKLKEEIAALNAQISQNLSGQGAFAQKAQALRDKSLTPEQADAKNAAAARNALDEAQKLALYAQNAAFDGRAQQAQQYAERATKLLDEAGKAADKLNDSDFAAKIFEQLDAAQTQLLQGQKAIKEQALADTQAQTEGQSQQLAALEERLAALKSGASIKVEVPTDAAIAQANAIKEALDAAAAPRTAVVTVQQVGSAGGEAPSPDAPARAYGGVLPGYAPHDRADNMLYWGTPGEYVVQRPIMRQPMALSFMREFNRIGMDAVRNWRLPRHAFGGELGAPFIDGIRVPNIPPPSYANGGPMQARDLVMPNGARFPIQTAPSVGQELEDFLAFERLAHGRRVR